MIKDANTINDYIKQIDDLKEHWSKQQVEINAFHEAVEPLFNRIENAETWAGKKTTLEFTPDELESLLEAVGCAFEYHGYRMLADTNGIRIEAIQQILRDPTIKDGRTKLKKITDIIAPSILNEKTHPEARKITQYRWLIGEIPENIYRFFHEDLKYIKQSMKNQEIPVSRSDALKILADYYAEDIDTCRQSLYRAGIRTRKMAPGDEKAPTF